ncbi:ABC transporter ATP-binding protein [Ancylobacter amanitiformis]|uniref:Simple sugar transport system ATP-binding protein n=1 Tax=Ancylobacter amanitiformis TaxID=217069 RepID=A0ABU0LLB8_9HYPH|nr:ABC transporter ATP-binding protein [Ancylobacter amanitiformis]MDQ0509500.1 simple sugar transport system ATP-binding protein [Ancylobacter amanitiformis]
MHPDPRPLVLSLAGITKRFGPLTANDHIDLDVRAGEIVALLGENGAGKTTLMSILFGHYVADEGVVHIAGADGQLAPLPGGSAEAALAAGIGMVHQHFALAENLTGFENIVLGTQSLWSLGLRRGAARAKLERLITESGLATDLDVPVARLSVGEQQRIEILKALYRDVRVLILDEPTAVLTPQEADSLAATVRTLARKGLAVIFISHKLHEVLALCERVVVLRGGAKVADQPTLGASRASLAELMVGRPIPARERPPANPGAPVLDLRGVSVGAPGQRDRLEGADLEVRAGEIVGIAGVSGNGQGALAQLVAGLASPRAGEALIAGVRASRADPAGRIAAGIGRIPEDRHRDGTIGALSVAENYVLETIAAPENQRAGLVRRSDIRRRAARAIADYDVRCPGPDAAVRALSGGNMQKVVLARVLERAPRLVLAHQPTRGLDIGATTDVHRRLIAARDRGAAVLLISEDLDELFALSDRIAVVHAGHLSAAMDTAGLDIRKVGLMMAGHAAEEAA